MNGPLGLGQSLFAPLVMSLSDMLLLLYLCGDSWDEIRKRKYWAFWFTLSLIALIATQLIFNGKTIARANFLIFYALHFLILLFFSGKSTDSPLSARFYLVLLSVLANDVCLILLIGLTWSILHFDYIDVGTFPARVIAHFILLAMKIGVTIVIKKQTRKQIYGIESVFQAFIIILPALPYFLLRGFAFLFRISPTDVPLMIHYINVLFGIFALINMIISEQLSYRIRQHDLMRVESLAKKQYDHYQSTLNAIETVNRKYHDLRHILRGIESMHSVSEIKAFIKTFEDEIQDYELIFNTGNKTLDVILSEKIQESKNKGAQVHVRADGHGWNVIRDTDIATIFGNALDNAIENTERNSDPSTRLIDVRTGRVNGMLIARFENPYTHTLVKKQSKWISTKSEPQDHGYGLQSIEMVVKKYGGEMNINTDNGLFILTVIIPVPAASDPS
jgi:hypothetical protein